MKIFYDGLIYEMYKHRPGGISNFFDNLISNVSQGNPCLLTSTRPRHQPHPSGPNLTIARFDHQIRPRRLQPLIQRTIFGLRTRTFLPDLIHLTYYKNPTVLGRRIPLVCTVFDMIHEIWGEQIDEGNRVATIKYECMRRASALPCISKSTQDDVIARFPELEGKTTVIYLAGGLPEYCGRSSDNQADDGKRSDYFLYVGDRRSYKNFTRALIAFSGLMTTNNKLRFLIAGYPLSNEEKDLVEALDIKNNVVVCSNATNEQLITLYKGAICLVYPSLYEGFGMPVLEAMSLGIPVIASKSSSIPEVAGDAAFYVNPYDVTDLRQSMLALVENDSLRRDLCHKGLKRSKLFSWQKTTGEYLSLYERVIKNKSLDR